MASVSISDVQPVEVYPFLPRPEFQYCLAPEQQLLSLYDMIENLTERVAALEKKVDPTE